MAVEHYDVAVVGGGMAGATLVVALAHAGFRVAVIEAFPPESDVQPSFDARTTALSDASFRFFTHLGLWKDIAHQPIKKIHVSQRGIFGSAWIDHQKEGLPALGYVVENAVLGATLWSRLRDADVGLFCPNKLVALEQDEKRVTLGLESGQQINANLVVGADGARSKLRDLLGIDFKVKNYGQTAVVTNFAIAGDHQGVAYERFTKNGPIAVLPMADQRCAAVWVNQPEHADTLLALSDEDFQNKLQEAFGFRLGYFHRVGKRFAYPLSLTVTDQVVAERALLLGNAANSLHPVAGQGFNLGLRDAACLVECLIDQRQNHDADCGAQEVLGRYASWRKADHQNLVRFTDALIHGFALQAPGANFLRGAGVMLFDTMPAAKSLLAQMLVGRGQAMPRSISQAAS